MTRPSLAGIEQRAAARVSYADERSETEHDQGEYSALADESAADVEALTAAVRDVLALHESLPNSRSALFPHPLCSCGKASPCPTVRALTACLDLTDPKEK